MPSNPSKQYYEWTYLRNTMLWCYDAIPQRKARRTDFYPRCLNAWLVRNGETKVEINGKITIARPGQWMIPKPVPRIHDFPDTTHLLSIGFQTKWSTGEHFFNQGLPCVLDAKDYPQLEEYALELLEENNKIAKSEGYLGLSRTELPFNTFMRIQQKYNRWFEALYEALGKEGIQPTLVGDIDERVQQAINLIESHPLGKTFQTSAVAKAIGISSAQLDRLFRKQLNHTPKHHFDLRRIEYAIDFLCRSNVQIKEIAFALGFSSMGHFTKWFKNSQYCSPTVFREKFASEPGSETTQWWRINLPENKREY